MYSPPILNVWLPPQPVFRKLTEPLTCGRSISRSSATAPPLTVFAPTSDDARRRALERRRRVGLIAADARFDVDRVGQRGVVLALPHGHGKHEAWQRIAGLDRLARAGDEKTRLLESLVLHIADELLARRQQVGDLAGADRRPRAWPPCRAARGIAARPPSSGRRRTTTPCPFFRYPPTSAVKSRNRCSRLTSRASRPGPPDTPRAIWSSSMLVAAIAVVLEIRVDAAVISVAAGLADVLAQGARHGHRGRVSDGLDRNLRKRREVGEVVVAGPVGPADSNAFDLVAVHAGGRPQTVGGVLLQAERAVAADVHLRHRHARRVGQDRKEVARARQAGELLAVEMRRDGRGRDVHHGRRR